jgi:hypothetical protein
MKPHRENNHYFTYGYDYLRILSSDDPPRNYRRQV